MHRPAPAARGLVRRVIRIVLVVVLALVGAAVAAIATAYVLLPRFDLAPFAGRRASAALGREVTIAEMHVAPGRWLTVDLDGVQVANVTGGSSPEMIQLGHVTAEVEALSLLHGPAVLRRLDVDRLVLLLERTAADRIANWMFGPPRSGRAAPPADNSWFPILLHAHVRGSEVTFRTAGGHTYRTRLDDASINTAGPDTPVSLAAVGAYNNTPVSLTGELASIVALRAAPKPYGAELQFASWDTTLEFRGTLTDPLNVDGARGTLALRAPSTEPIFAIAGATSDFETSLDFAGDFERSGNLWRLSRANGALKGETITSASLRLTEGNRDKPDEVAVDLVFAALEMDRLLARGAHERKAAADADITLDIVRAPDPLISAHIAADALTYARFRFAETELTAELVPGKVVVQALALTYLGARVKATGRIEAAEGGGGNISADVSVATAEIDQLRRALGFGPLPLNGKIEAKAVASGSGATLNAAVRAAQVWMVASMTSGSIAREVIEMTSTDIRLLFRKPRGMTPVSCMLAVLKMRGGIGTVQPLRIRSATGAIVGEARFDLDRGTFDLTIASQSATTGFFALDIPLRVHGTFANPTVGPAQGSAAGRATLAAINRVADLPKDLQSIAERNPCFVVR
jgi:uncharacterized protein involved in outer membrane biogenesis